MKFKPKATDAGFTLAEVLAALVFMAILIPVALEGLSIASRAGEVAARKQRTGRNPCAPLAPARHGWRVKQRLPKVGAGAVEVRHARRGV